MSLLFKKKIRKLFPFLSRQFFRKVSQSFLSSVRYSDPNITMMGAVGTFGFPIYYFIWKDFFPQTYENWVLRGIGSLICLFLLLKKFWPKKLQVLLPYYWYFSILYCLPFFFTFMLLKNQFSTVWVLSFLTCTLLTIILLEWISLILITALGFFLGWLLFFITGPTVSIPTVTLTYIPVFLFALIGGCMFNYKKSYVNQEKRKAILLVSNNIAHELRTPLFGMKGGAIGIKKYFPHLLEGYQKAKEAGFSVSEVSPAHLEIIEEALDVIEKEVDYANLIIDILLKNTQNLNIASDQFISCSIANCIESAIDRFQHKTEAEKIKIFWEREKVFQFWGSEVLMIHVLFNLLTNSFYFLKKAEKGSIRIVLSQGPKQNYLSFKDSGPGIPPDIQPYIFNRFFSSSLTGTGLGLAFCKMVMESFGGKISCQTEVNLYTEFIMSFPREKK